MADFKKLEGEGCNRDCGGVCPIHDSLSKTLDDVNDKLNEITPQLEDLTWIKTIGRFLIGIVVTLFFTMIPLTYKIFMNMSDILVQMNLNTQKIDSVEKHLHDHEVRATEVFDDIGEALRDLNNKPAYPPVPYGGQNPYQQGEKK